MRERILPGESQGGRSISNVGACGMRDIAPKEISQTLVFPTFLGGSTRVSFCPFADQKLQVVFLLLIFQFAVHK